MKKRKVPLRKCISCGENKPKSQLIRIVKTTDNNIELDLTGKKNGRGAYICLDNECLNTAIKSKVLSRSLGKQIDDSVYQELIKLIEKEVIDQEDTFK